MKKWMIYSILALWACGEDSEDLGVPDQLLLLSDREVICSGQTATFRLFSTASRKEVPISEFTFDPLPIEIGSISSAGLLTLGTVNSSTEITISGTYKSKSNLNTKVKVQASSESSTPSLVISPFGFYNPDLGRPFYFWKDGTVTGKFGPESLKQFEVLKYSGAGMLQWKKEFGSGEAKFIQVFNNQIYVAGVLSELGGGILNVVMIFDLAGNLVWEKKMPTSRQHVFSAFQVDHSGNFYLSTYTDGSSFNSSFAKYNLDEKLKKELLRYFCFSR